ncbi:MAG TPA: FAD-dependent oxidoreductase [Pseudomonadota bacterium]|nr:FAD-dependent oxidoreductase [Pseudomonadota bacterium]
MRDPRYDLLFEPVRIGPVRTKNRFYQVPHCNGMGHAYPQTLARMRGVKAEGGWGVVATEEVEISPLSEIAPHHEGRLWDETDIPALRRMTDAVHEHGALAAIELMFNGHATPNRYSREIPIAPSHIPVRAYDPIQARTATKRDIANVRRWHRNAALRARDAGFDLVYVYAGHDLGMPLHFLSRRTNQRSDEYGGSLENRARLLRELIEDTKDAVGDRCGVVVRLAVDQLLGPDGLTAENEGRDAIALLAELPDLWDVNIADWSNDSQTARFSAEGFQEPYLRELKVLTTKPVVGVGRYTSPDAMVRVIKSGLMDLIGAARPSIADPFLPKKIETGQLDAIRECIGCNICVTGDNYSVPIRCTQNPTMGEEWRRDWHPERIAPKRSQRSVLVVGAGPAGLELTRALGQRGYEVMLCDAADTAGGRLRFEAKLPGLATWQRVADHRLLAIAKMPNVQLLRGGAVSADDALAFGASAIFLATGAHWRTDGVGRTHRRSILAEVQSQVLSPDAALRGAAATGPLVIYDDDHYVLAGALAERYARDGVTVHYVTPAAKVSEWTEQTMEQSRVQRRLIELGVQIHAQCEIAAASAGGGDLRIELDGIYGGPSTIIEAKTLLPVTMRDPDDALYQALMTRAPEWADAGVREVHCVGDAFAPGTVAAAVYSGHKAARAFDEPEVDLDAVPFKRERIALA